VLFLSNMFRLSKARSFSLWIVCIIFFILAFAAGWFSRGQASGVSFIPNDPALRAPGNYKYINPLLTCGTWDSKDFDEYAVFKNQVTHFIADTVKAGTADTVSVYFRDLSGPHWFGVNENLKFSPASLLKVPVMIAYLKYAEKNPEILKKTIAYDGSVDLNKHEYFRSPYYITPGKSYKVSDLLTAMIVNSDNNATALLDTSINPHSLTEVFTDLGLSIPDNTTSVDSIDFMSPKSYSYFFRVLYNATYLSRDSSERALDLLHLPDFLQGIEATVPTDVTVAQKFGERSVLTSTGALDHRELHDCGIVYHPKYPYVICVMTKGKDFAGLVSTIQNINRIVYDDVSKSEL